MRDKQWRSKWISYTTFPRKNIKLSMAWALLFSSVQSHANAFEDDNNKKIQCYAHNEMEE